MNSLFGKPPTPQLPPPLPQVDDTNAARDQADNALRRRRQSTVLTSNGLPNLGTTRNVTATS